MFDIPIFVLFFFPSFFAKHQKGRAIKSEFILTFLAEVTNQHHFQLTLVGWKFGAMLFLKRAVSSNTSSFSRSFGRSSNSISNRNGSSATGWKNKINCIRNCKTNWSQMECLPRPLDHNIVQSMDEPKLVQQWFVCAD